MRKFVTAAATAAVIGLFAAAPAMADQYTPGRGEQGQHRQGGEYQDNGYRQANGQGYGQGYGQDHGYRDIDDAGDGYRGIDRWRDRRFDFDRYEGRYDRWERGWGRGGRDQYRYSDILSERKLVRRLARQGYYGVRGLRPSRWGWGWKAFAFTYRGDPVMLRVNPYTGDVLEARRV